ncbi:uncharacterized protein COLE_02479 [Cutaneotrichosporon oleaginosum]|nr:hypothetical protein COLE_02479 [Cutaneotrichosporon oleaginosum]
MAQAMRAGVVQLSLHLRGALLAASGVVGPRLSDADIRVLLEEAPRETPTDAGGEAREWEEHDDWDKDTARPSLHHLPLMAHPSPLRLLRDVPRFTGLTLTSLDLAFATLPLERVIGVLPASLRALGLAGARARDWERGLGALGRKMRVLRTLDVSYCPLGARGTVGALFPPRTIGPQPLPSLRVLGLCGAGGDLGDEEEAPPRRKALRAAVIEGAGHWVDVRFE